MFSNVVLCEGGSFTELLNTVGNWLVTEGLKIVIALLVMFIVFKVTNFIMKKLDKSLSKSHKIDATLRGVIVPWTRRIIKFFVLIAMLGYLGVETSGIAAAIASVGVTIGLALQGSLSNFAGGIVIVVLHPYRIDDYITCDGSEGTVEKIELFYTYVRTPDNKVVVIPNGKAANSTVVNYSIKDSRRDDITFSISYDNDFESAKQVLSEVVDGCEFILKDPAPFINVKEHGDSSINILVRYWAKSEDFWNAHWYMMEAVKKAFDENGISIPYPQMDVHAKALVRLTQKSLEGGEKDAEQESSND